MKLAALVGVKRTIQVPVGAGDGEAPETVEVVYRPGALTIGQIEKVSNLSGTANEMEVLGEVLIAVIESWDIQDEDGDGNTVQLPVNMEGMRKVPVNFLMQVFDMITTEARPNPTTPSNSEDTSQPTEASDESQNGMGSFARHDT
jgi:hypothetical protein